MGRIEFNAEFIERRMAEHERWRHRVEHVMCEEIIEEVQALPKRKPGTRYLFEDELPTGIEMQRVRKAANLA